MAPPRRSRPLQAPPRFTPVRGTELLDPDPPGPGSPPAPPAARGAPAARRSRRGRLRSALLGLGVGAAVGLAGMAIAFSVLAIPLFFVASTEPGSGAHRDLVQKGLFYVALPFGGVAGLLGGIVVGIWYGRGGRLPRDPR